MSPQVPKTLLRTILLVNERRADLYLLSTLYISPNSRGIFTPQTLPLITRRILVGPRGPTRTATGKL